MTTLDIPSNASREAAARVLLASASLMRAEALKDVLSGALDIVGISRTPRDTLRALETYRPCVLCIDDTLPLSALSLTRDVMSAQPTPILVLAPAPLDASLLPGHPALSAGALAVWPRPSSRLSANDADVRQLVAKIKMLSRVPVISRRKDTSGHAGNGRGAGEVAPSPVASPPSPSVARSPFAASSVSAPLTSAVAPSISPSSVVAIGASTGGPQALLRVLSALPAEFPLPILCVQHVSRGFLDGLVGWLNEQCRLRVAVADDGEIARAGTVYFPREERHLEIDARGMLRLSSAPPVGGHRPSVTVTFNAVARAFGSRAVAVLLTGMGEDGATGMKSVARGGGQTVAQTQESCVVFGMPKAAIDLNAAKHVLAPDEIARFLCSLARKA